MQNKARAFEPVICLSLFIGILLSACGAPATATPAPIQATEVAPAALEIPVATGDWPPYTGEKLEGQGAFTEIVAAVFKEMGQPVKFQFYPWKRAENEIQEGRVFAAFPYIATDERKKDYDFSDPVMVSTGKLFYMPKHQKGEITFNKLEDLQSYNVGGVLGYWYEGPFKQAGLKVDYAASDELNVQKLYLGRIDLIVTDELVGWSLIKRLYPEETDQFATLPQTLNEDPLRLMISRKYPGASALTLKFNVALKTVADKGIIKQILEKYGVK